MLRFIDCTVTLLYEEFQRVGQDVFEAFESTRRWVSRPLEDDTVAVRETPTETVPSASDNDRSMQQFQALLGGIGGMPG